MTADRRIHVELDSISHSYGSDRALEDVTLKVSSGEFVTLLGPSGCGKTTLLRIIAGFVVPSEGSVRLDGVDITRMPPHKRPVNLVFQRPALFPHLNDAGNIAFGLRLQKVDKSEVRERVADALTLVRLDGLGHRYGHELSGGQLQRVALARALVRRPAVMLLDEPLSALDQRIRLEMEEELRRIHRETGATFIHVTHDQTEALALSDRIAVLDNGRLAELGTPLDIYLSPRSTFAAGFVGDANVLPVEVVEHEGGGALVRMGEHQIRVPGPTRASGQASLVLRPEMVEVSPDPGGSPSAIRAVVRDVAFRGTRFMCLLEVAGLEKRVKAAVSIERGQTMEVGDVVAITWRAGTEHLLAAGERPLSTETARSDPAGV